MEIEPLPPAPPLPDELREPVRQRAALLFAALSHPTRLAIVEYLTGGPRTVGEIALALHLGQSAASQHLATLTRAGLLVAEPRSSTRKYRVRGPRIKYLLTLIEEFCAVHSLYGTDEAVSAEPDEPP